MKYVEITGVNNWKKFNEEGDFVEGILTGIGERESTYGVQKYLTLVQEDDEYINVGITSSLSYVNFESLIDKFIKIEYVGYVLNKNTRRKYKSFKIYEGVVNE